MTNKTNESFTLKCRICPHFRYNGQATTLQELWNEFKHQRMLGVCECSKYPMFEDEECGLKKEATDDTDDK